MIKSLRLIIKNAAITYAAVLGGILVYITILYLQSGMPEHVYKYVLTFAFAMTSLLMPFICMSTTITVQFNIAVSYGCTRNNFFWGTQLCKLIVALLCFTICGAALFVIADEPRLTLITTLAITAVNFFLACFGELMGVLTLRYGAWVSIVTGILFGLSFGAIGFFVGFSGASSDEIVDVTDVFELVSQFENLIVIYGVFFLIVALGLAFVSKVIICKISVK